MCVLGEGLPKTNKKEWKLKREFILYYLWTFVFFSPELYEIFLSRAKERWKSFSTSSSDNDTEGMGVSKWEFQSPVTEYTGGIFLPCAISGDSCWRYSASRVRDSVLSCGRGAGLEQLEECWALVCSVYPKSQDSDHSSEADGLNAVLADQTVNTGWRDSLLPNLSSVPRNCTQFTHNSHLHLCLAS